MTTKPQLSPLDRLRWRVRHLSDRCAKLEDGLRPFAKEAERWGPQHPGDLVQICDLPDKGACPPERAAFNLNDIRRAHDLVFDGADYETAPSKGEPELPIVEDED